MNNDNMVNIGGNPNDANHRYKRERIELERVNRQGGMRHITNLRKIIGQLSQTSINVGAFEQEYYDRVKRTGLRVSSDKWFKGDITVEKLEEILNGMIKEIILCPKCGLPEWDHQYCRSCGHIKKKKTKKRSTTHEEDGDEEKKAAPCLIEAVKVMNQMYTLYAKRCESTTSLTSIDWNLMEKCMDKFWEISNDNENMHRDFSVKMRSMFPLE